MKKSFKTLTLGLLTIGMLAGCGQKPAPTWSSEDAKTMSDNLYGLVLPFVSLANSKVEFDSENKSVVVTGDELDSTVIAAYAQNFKESDGWVDLSKAEDGFYTFEKQVFNAQEQKRWVAVQFGNEDVEDASGDNTGPLQADGDQPAGGEGQGEGQEAAAKRFALYAGDPYLYDQALMISTLQQDIYDMCHITNQPIPNFPAERYLAELDPTGQYANTFLFFTDATGPSQYKAALEAAPYNYHVKVDQATGLYTANTDTENFVLKFQYSAELRQTALWAGNFTDWPAISISNLVKGLFPNATSNVPEYEQGFRAVFASGSSSDIEVQVIYKLPEGTTSYSATTLAAAKANYSATLLAAEYAEGLVSGEKTFFSKDGQFQIQLGDYSAQNYYDRFNIEISAPETKDLTAWPAEQLAAYFTAKGITGSLPAFPTTAEGVSYRFLTYDVEDDADPQAVVLIYGAGKDYSGYKATMLDGGYKVENESSSAITFVPASGIPDRRVRVTTTRSGAIGIYVFPLEVDTTFPMDKVLAELRLESNPYPSGLADAFANVYYFETSVEFEQESIYVYANFNSDDDATACKNALVALFEADSTNWVKVGNGAYRNLNNTDLTIYVGVSSSNSKKVYADFTKTRHYTQFPQSVIVSRLNLNPAYSFLIPVPSFSNNDWIIDVAYGSGFTQVTVSAEFATTDDATAAAAAYVTSLTGAGYSLVSDPWYGFSGAIYAKAVAVGNELDIVFQF